MITPQLLQERFLEPEGWRWHHYHREGRALRFGSVLPAGPPAAHVICLPGLSEFGEKYFETARECLRHNMGFWVIDWFGQGGSGRYFKDCQKRHSHGFEKDIEDLDSLIKDFTLAPDVPVAPLIMLSHSMGGNIGFRYLQMHPNIFTAAAFSAPLWMLKVFENWPPALILLVLKVLNGFLSFAYAPGERDWDPMLRSETSDHALSKDEHRVQIHTYWSMTKPELRVGGVTFGWLLETVRSCQTLSKQENLEKVTVSCLIATAGEDRLVCNRTIKDIADRLKNVTLAHYPAARHEILMECEEVRAFFMARFFEMVIKNTSARS